MLKICIIYFFPPLITVLLQSTTPVSFREFFLVATKDSAPNEAAGDFVVSFSQINVLEVILIIKHSKKERATLPVFFLLFLFRHNAVKNTFTISY